MPDDRVLCNINIVVPGRYKIILKRGEKGDTGQDYNDRAKETGVFCKGCFRRILY